MSRDSSTSLGMTSGLDVIAPVHVWKNVVAPFAVAEEFFTDTICYQLIVQPIESNKMICDALRCVFARGPRFHQKWPITGLRQQKFTGELFEYAIGALAAVFLMPACNFIDSLCRAVQMRINPSVTRIEPDTEMAVLAPCRSGRLNNLLRGIRRQIFARRGKPKIPFIGSLANKFLKETWS